MPIFIPDAPHKGEPDVEREAALPGAESWRAGAPSHEILISAAGRDLAAAHTAIRIVAAFLPPGTLRNCVDLEYVDRAGGARFAV